MAKKGINYVDASEFETIIVGLGAAYEAQAGFVKVTGPAKGRAIYVAKTKSVGRVDISGFSVDEAFGVRAPDGGPFGNVTQQLDFTLPEKDILMNFEALVAHMLSLPDAEPRKRTSPTSNKADAAKGWSVHVPAKGSPEANAARLALIAKVAGEKQVDISQATLESLSMDDVESLAHDAEPAR